MPDAKTIAFFPEPGAWGPTNDCAAIGSILMERGHRVVFVIDESFAGVLEPRGFEERLFRTAPGKEATTPSDGGRRTARPPRTPGPSSSASPRRSSASRPSSRSRR